VGDVDEEHVGLHVELGEARVHRVVDGSDTLGNVRLVSDNRVCNNENKEFI